jgi:asparagine synthase (glutamine-hydrolysing)
MIWFGQLMNAPQLLAYMLQIEYWMREYKVEIA